MYSTFNRVFSNHGSLTSVSETREEVQANFPAKTEEGVVVSVVLENQLGLPRISSFGLGCPITHSPQDVVPGDK